MKYSPKYFKDNMPEWKRKKDPILSRLFYRPMAFVFASICARLGVNANDVSYFSAVVAVVGACLFLPDSYVCHVIGAVVVNFWLILDCTDGNLARSYRRQTFGEFADGISSYILVGLLCTMIGFATYWEGGLLVNAGCPYVILLGALASTSDTLMRLVYQKYKATERELSDEGFIEVEKDSREDHSKVGSLRVRIESELGIGGLLPLAILLATVFNSLDLIVFYCFFYYGLSCCTVLLLYVRKARKRTKFLS